MTSDNNIEKLIVEDENRKQLDEYYIIREKGGGGFSEVYLVRNINTQIVYAAKILRPNALNFLYEREKGINMMIRKFETPNVVNFIEAGRSLREIKGEKALETYSFIFDYYSKGDLLQFIMSSHSGGLPEILSKIIFKKLLETIQKIHMLGIFHFDIKLQNILLDDNFNPILGDFGLSRLKTEAKNGKFIGNFGTRCFKAPQMFLGLDFEGIKADIFSLGATLFNLILGKTIFRFKSKFSQNDKVNYDDKLKELLKDKFYSLIMKNKIYDFWEAVSLKYHPVISPEFKKLIIRMVAFLEKDRPDNIQEILEDEWFKDINNLTPQEEENYILEMKKREELKNSIFNPTENVTSKENENINESNFKISFEDKMTPRTIKEDLKFDTFIRIKGNLNALLFMNSLYQEVAVLFGSEIDEKEKNLKFKIIIKAKKDDDLEEEEDDDDSDNELEKDLIIQVELLKINEQEYILNFIKEKGELSDFYHYVKEIINYAKKYI